MTRYTDDFRASAILMLESAGYPERRGALMETAKALKMPHNTLSQWFRALRNPVPAEVRQIKKEQIVEILRGEIYAAIMEMVNARPDADYRELATAMGIMIDKMQLLDGQPTERTAITHELTPEQRANRITELLDAARARRDRQPPNSDGIVQ